MVSLLALLATTAVWGATFVIVKDAITRVPTFEFLTLRFAIAAIALAAINFRRISGTRAARPGLVIGVALAAGYAFQTVGLESTTATNAAFITGMFIVFTPILSAVVLKRPPTGWAWFGVVSALAGMALLTGTGWPPSPRPGDWLVLLCALAFALHIIALGKWSGPHDPRELATWQVAVAAVLFGVASLGSEWVAPDATVWLALGITAVAGTAFAFSVQTWAQSRLSPTRTALALAMEPVFGGAYAWLAVNEKLSTLGWVGAALILGGILAAELGSRVGVPPPTPGEGG